VKMKRKKKYRLKNPKRLITAVFILILVVVGILAAIIPGDEEPSVVTASATTIESPETELIYIDDVFTSADIALIAKTVYGEALVTGSDTEMSAVAWCILNRVDSPKYGNTVSEVVTQELQFHGYNKNNPVDEHIVHLVRDVLGRYCEEKNGNENAGRTLPKDYLYFYGDGRHNHFTTEWQGKKTWDWSLPSPYES